MCEKWLQEATNRMINVFGPMLIEKNLKFAEDLGKRDFKATTGSLNTFVKINNLGTNRGRRGDIVQATVEECKNKLGKQFKAYSPWNIFNMGETGLFFRGSNTKTFHYKRGNCKGGKLSKEKLTVGLCASMMGEKETPIVISKSQKPRCLATLAFLPRLSIIIQLRKPG